MRAAAKVGGFLLLWLTWALADGAQNSVSRGKGSSVAGGAIELGASVDALQASKLAFLGHAVGDARVVGFGEAKHGIHEMLILRNRIFEYLVEKLGFSAIAAESGFADGTLVDDYVTGSSQVTQERAIREVFTFDPDGLEENRELIEWMRSYNARPATRRKIRFYGLDMMGRGVNEGSGNPYARKAFDAALRYMDVVAPQSAAAFHLKLEPLLARLARDSYERLTEEEKTALTVSTADLVALFERRHIDWVERSSSPAYHRAYRNALNARGIDADFRAMGWWSQKIVDIGQRDAELAKHVQWAIDQEGDAGKLFVFAHVGHLRKGPSFDASGQRQFTAMGEHLNDVLGKNYVVIGSVYAPASAGSDRSVSDDDWQEVSDANRLIARTGTGVRAFDFRNAAGAWDPGLLSYNPGKRFILDPVRCLDALIYVDTISTAHTISSSDRATTHN